MDRVARMYSSFDRRPQNRQPQRKPDTSGNTRSAKDSGHESSGQQAAPGHERTKPDIAPPKAPGKQTGLLELLMKDKDQSLIMLLLVILMKDGADMDLLLALVYLLI